MKAHVLLPVLILLAACGGCKCSNTDQDGLSDTSGEPDGMEVLDIRRDSDVAADPITDGSTDIDTEDAPEGDCFEFTGEEYDLSGAGFTEIPRSRSQTPCGECCIQISFSLDRLSQPSSLDTWGRYIVYSTIRESPRATSRVIIIEPLTGTEHLIEEVVQEGELYEAAYYPTIYQDSVFFAHEIHTATDEGRCEIVRHSLSDGTRDIVHSFDMASGSSGGWCSMHLDAHENWLTWQDNRDRTSGSQRARVLELSTGEESTISSYSVLDTSIWGDHATFRDASGTYQRIKIYTISSGEMVDLTTEPHDTWYPSLFGNHLAWSDARSGGSYADMSMSDIYLMNLDTGAETAVCTHPASQFGSFVHEDLVVWTDLRDDPEHPNSYSAAANWNVYAYWISSGAEARVTDLPGREWAVGVNDMNVLFLMRDEAGVQSIFLASARPPG